MSTTKRFKEIAGAVATAAVICVLFGSFSSSANAQTTLFMEDFEDDGNRQYTTIGEGVCSTGTPDCPDGLGFFAHNSAVVIPDVTNWEGSGYFGQANTNEDWPTGFIGSDPANSREMLFDPIDTNAAGSDPIKVTLKIGASLAAWEGTGHAEYDWFRVLVDPENDGSFLQMAEFNGDAFNNLAFDQNESMIGAVDGPVTIDTAMQDMTIKLPPSANFQPNLVVKFQMRSTSEDEIVAWDNVRVHTACPCHLFTTSDFAKPMGNKKKLGQTLKVKFQFSFDGVEITSQDQLDQVLVEHGCEPACPEIRITDITGPTEIVTLADKDICFLFKPPKWLFSLQLSDETFVPGHLYRVEVQLGDCLLTRGNNQFETKSRGRLVHSLFLIPIDSGTRVPG